MNQTADSTITLRVETTADPAALTATAAAVEQVAEASHKQTAATRTLNEATSTATVTANGLSNAKERVKTSSANAGLAFLQFSRAAQDAQYGIAGVINNVEGLVSAMGLGAGLAGVISVAAVGIQLLVQHTDILGLKAAEAAEKAKEQADALRKAADSAAEDARHAEASAAANDRMADSLERVTEKHKELVASLEREAKIRSDIRRLAMAENDAGADLELAKIDADEQKGKLSPVAAAVRRAQVVSEREKAKFEADQRASKQEEERGVEKARSLQTVAGAQESEANRIADMSRGLMNPEERKAAANELEAQKAAEKLAADQRKIAADKVLTDGMSILNASHGMASPESVAAATADARRKEEAAKQAEEAAAAERTRLEEALRVDKLAQERLGDKIPDARTAREKQDELRDAARQARQQADNLIEDSNLSQKMRERERSVFNTRQRTRDLQTGTQVDTLNEDAMDDANKGRADQTKAREGLKKTAGREFGQLRKSAEDAGASEKGLAQMEAAFTAYLEGNAKAVETYKRLTAQLVSALPKLEADAKEALAAAESARRGK